MACAGRQRYAHTHVYAHIYISYLRIFLTVSYRLCAANSINNWPFLPLPANDKDFTYRSLRYRNLKRAQTPFVRARQSAQTQVVSFVFWSNYWILLLLYTYTQTYSIIILYLHKYFYTSQFAIFGSFRLTFVYK